MWTRERIEALRKAMAPCVDRPLRCEKCGGMYYVQYDDLLLGVSGVRWLLDRMTQVQLAEALPTILQSVIEREVLPGCEVHGRRATIREKELKLRRN